MTTDEKPWSPASFIRTNRPPGNERARSRFPTVRDRPCRDNDRMNVGDEWIYRRRPYSPSERVRIIDIEKRKQTIRVDIEFLDGDKAGVRENVPGTRLPRPWNHVGAYDELMANWQRLDQDVLDETEESAVGDVFDLLIPDSVATYYDSPVRNGATVRDRRALEQLMRRPVGDVLDHVEWSNTTTCWSCLLAERF